MLLSSVWNGLSYHCERNPHREPYSRQKNIGPVPVSSAPDDAEAIVAAFLTGTFLVLRAVFAITDVRERKGRRG
jgi:hypothetical protein